MICDRQLGLLAVALTLGRPIGGHMHQFGPPFAIVALIISVITATPVMDDGGDGLKKGDIPVALWKGDERVKIA